MQNVLVTGGSSGIGNSIIKILNQNGYNSVNFDLKKNNYPNFYKTDLASIKSIYKNFNTVVKKYKKIHSLINCAGVTFPGNSKNYSLNNWERTLKVNLTAPFFLSQIVAKNMIKNKIKGSIVNITSIGAELAFPDNPAYQASKAGLKHLTKALAYDFSKYNIRVNSLAPGYTVTPMNRKSFKNKILKKKRSNRSMLNRWGFPFEIAETAIFLISEKSSFTTGQNFIVDGGWTSKGF